jgi:hypothetical protein
MKRFWSISLMAAMLAGCVSIKPPNLVHNALQTIPVPTRVTRYHPPVTNHLFKATIDIKKHHLTGLLVIKRIDTIPLPTPHPAQLSGDRTNQSDVFRIVFMNEVGMTFFDLELDSSKMKVVSCFASLNKKALMKILETDLNMLLCEDAMNNEKLYRQETSGNIIISGQTGKYRSWQTWSPSGDTLRMVSGRSTIADPVVITYENYSGGIPSKITISNAFIGLKMSLKKLTR